MKRAYHNTIWKKVGEAIGDYKMIRDGDSIGVGISGGKDSLVLTWVLANLRQFAPVRFTVTGLTVEMGYDMDLSGVRAFCSDLGVPFYTRETNIWPVIFEKRKEQNPCALCAHLRRGSLNSLAKEHGCNKVALAHHLDDAIETLFMSMWYEGRIESFKPVTHLSESGITVIRPLFYVTEESIATAARELALPVVESPCPETGKTKRQEAKLVVSSLASSSKDFRSKMKSCLVSLHAPAQKKAETVALLRKDK